MRLAALLRRQWALLAAGAATYVAVFALFLMFERPGLGIAHGFYLAVIFVSLAAGPLVGGGAGLLATVLYALGIWINPRVPVGSIPTLATSIRGVSYLAVGVVVGWNASRNRALNGRPICLLIADVDGLKRINAMNGYDEGNDLLRNISERLAGKLPVGSDIARVGDDEFAILIPCRKAEEAASFAGRLEADLDIESSRVTFGWAMHPREGTNAFALYRVADERLYARKLMRGQRRGHLEPVEDPFSERAQPRRRS